MFHTRTPNVDMSLGLDCTEGWPVWKTWQIF